jgi:hypothetical protein
VDLDIDLVIRERAANARLICSCKTGKSKVLVPWFWNSECGPYIDTTLPGAQVSPRRAFVERRKNERVPLAVPVFVRGKDSEGKEFLEFATALNVSAGGALLATKRPLPLFTTIALEVPAAPIPRAKVLPRSVRHLKARLLRVAIADGYQLWGLKFSSPLISKNSGRKVHSLQ